MKFPLKIILSLFCLMMMNSCGLLQKPMSKSINKIMPLGASRVQGERPLSESYRFELWKDLLDAGFDFDFIGTRSDEADYPHYNGLEFDIDHEGRSGWWTSQILEGLPDWLQETGSPDIVLFSSPGINDAIQNYPYEETIDNINSIISLLRKDNPNVTILMEQMAPGNPNILSATQINYIVALQAEVVAIASNLTTASSRIIAVDMYTGFTQEMLADEVHYNQQGAEFVASRYYDQLSQILMKE